MFSSDWGEPANLTTAERPLWSILTSPIRPEMLISPEPPRTPAAAGAADSMPSPSARPALRTTSPRPVMTGDYTNPEPARPRTDGRATAAGAAALSAERHLPVDGPRSWAA